MAGLSVGRYLGLGTDSMQSVGAATILAYWQMNYKSGVAGMKASPLSWAQSNCPVRLMG